MIEVGQTIRLRLPIVGDISQSGVYPRHPSAGAAPGPVGIRAGNDERLMPRARSTGALHAQTLWADAIDQVEKRRLGQPLKIDQVGNVATFERNSAVVAFMCAVDQMEKIRALDDLEFPTTNLYCPVWNPIKLSIVPCGTR